MLAMPFHDRLQDWTKTPTKFMWFGFRPSDVDVCHAHQNTSRTFSYTQAWFAFFPQAQVCIRTSHITPKSHSSSWFLLKWPETCSLVSSIQNWRNRSRSTIFQNLFWDLYPLWPLHMYLRILIFSYPLNLYPHFLISVTFISTLKHPSYNRVHWIRFSLAAIVDTCMLEKILAFTALQRCECINCESVGAWADACCAQTKYFT